MKCKRAGRNLGFAVCLLILSVRGLLAQSVSDDITQLLLDVQKLTQLKQILSDMQKAYTMMSKGYEAVKDLSKGTFDLHKAYLDGLLLVSPAVSGYAKVGEIVTKQAELVREYQAANAYFRGSGRFTESELDHFSTVYANLFDGSLTNLSELLMVMTAGQLRMSDAERLAAVDRIDRNVSGQLGFLRAWNNNAMMQTLQRAKIEQELGTLRDLHGLGP